MQAEVRRKQKADVQEVTEAFRAKIAQGGEQGTKPKVRNHCLSYFSLLTFLFVFTASLGSKPMHA